MRADLLWAVWAVCQDCRLLCAARVAVVVWYGYTISPLYGCVNTFDYCVYLYRIAILHDFMPLL